MFSIVSSNVSAEGPSRGNEDRFCRWARTLFRPHTGRNTSSYWPKKTSEIQFRSCNAIETRPSTVSGISHWLMYSSCKDVFGRTVHMPTNFCYKTSALDNAPQTSGTFWLKKPEQLLRKSEPAEVQEDVMKNWKEELSVATCDAGGVQGLGV